jgi:tetratricopeptide (TPR) repeat protein
MRIPLSFALAFVAGLFFATPADASLFSHSEKEIQSKLNDMPADGRSKKQAGLYSDLATHYYRSGRMREAAATFERALECRTSKSQKRHIYRFLGKSYESDGRPDKAIEAYEQAVAYAPNNWRRHWNLAALYEEVQLFTKAESSYQAAIKHNSKEPALYVGLARTWRKMGLSDDAEDCLKKAHALGEDTALYYQELSFIYESQSRFYEAAKAYHKILKETSSPSDWGRLVYLASLGDDKETVNEGLNNLRKMDTPPQTMLFYEELADFFQKSPRDVLTMNISDPTLKTLVLSVRPKVAP